MNDNDSSIVSTNGNLYEVADYANNKSIEFPQDEQDKQHLMTHIKITNESGPAANYQAQIVASNTQYTPGSTIPWSAVVQESDVIALNPGQSTEIQFSWDLTQYNNRKYVYLAISSSKASGGSPVTDSSEDRHGGTYDTATNIYAPPVISGIKGRINESNDIDMLKFTATTTSPHILVNAYTSTVRMAIYSTAYGITLIDDKVMSPGTSFRFGSTAGEDYYIKIYDYWGVGNYEFWISRPTNEFGESDLEFKSATDRNFLYVNNPEYITKFDIVDSNEIERNYGQDKQLKIFEQTTTGKNTYYQTHISWYNNPDGHDEDFPDADGFYMDVDFYNPGSSVVTVTVENAVKGNSYAPLQNYFGGGENFTLTLQPGQHKRLLKNEHWDSPLHMSMWDGRSMAILFDFTVTGGDVVVSSLAAYNQENLVMQDWQKNRLANGTELNNGDIVYAAKPYVKNDPNRRRAGENDLYGKYKGIAKNQSAWIDANLEFAINDSTPSDRSLRVNLLDPEYVDDGVANPKNWWMTHATPTNDGYDALLYTMPSALHKFTYSFGNGQEWNFDYKHRNIKYDNLTISDQDTSISVNNPVPVSILNQIKSDVASGQKSYYEVPPGYYDDPDNTGKNPPDAEALGMAAWGTTYHYTISVDNQGQRDRVVVYRMRNSQNVIFGLKRPGQSNYETGIYSMGGGEGDWQTFVIDIPADHVTTFEIVTLPCGGTSGLNNQLILGEKTN